MVLNKKKKKFNIKILAFLSIPFVSIILTIPILIQQNYSTYRENLWTTYDNALDNSIALGIAPDFDTTSSAGKIKYAEYLNGFTNDILTKYKNINVMDGQEINRIGIEELKVDTMILNEWMRADEYKFDGIINDIAYTSMGDSRNATYNEDMESGGWIYSSQVSINKAFLMQANDLDKIYPNNNFSQKANDIISIDKKRIEYLNLHYRHIFENINIGIISGAKDSASINSELFFRSPGVYPFFYAQENNKGLGFKFPRPNNNSFLNNTHYKQHVIIGDTADQLLKQFSNKFDYIVYLSPDISSYTKEDVLNSKVKTLLKDPNNANKNILFSKFGKWYTSAWGIIGKRQLITYMLEFLNSLGYSIIDNKELIWEVPKRETLKKLRRIK